MLGYIQVRNNYVYATNSWIFVKIPVNEVFGEGVIQPDEELYFHADAWASRKADKAASFQREGVVFHTCDKSGNKVTVLQAITATDIEGRFPNIDGVIPTEESPKASIDMVGINPTLLTKIAKAFGNNQLHLHFYGMNKMVVVKSPLAENSIAGIIPLAIKS